MVHEGPSAKFSDLRPIASDPPLYHLWGIGLYFFGDRDFDVETGSFVRTLCFCFMYFPVLAWRAYRVAPTDDGWSVFGRVPVSRAARIMSLFTALALLGSAGFFGADAYLNSAGVVAQRRLAEADRLAAVGSTGAAAELLAELATGQTANARPSAERLAKLLDPTSKIAPDGRRAALAAAVKVQKAGRWPGTALSLHDDGLALARDVAANDPTGAWAILDAVAPLAPLDQKDATLRRDLLEKAVAADPNNPEWASRLAVDYEAKGELARCEKLLSPIRDRLGEFEGARVLGLIDARADRTQQAILLLRTYTKNRLERLAAAEKKLRPLYESFQRNLISRIEQRLTPDFDYSAYQRASSSRREEILRDYLISKVKGDTQIARAQQDLLAESPVASAAMELGLLLLHDGQAQTDPQARASLFKEAERTFFAVNALAGDRADYQLSLAQVYYWQGKHAEGRKLFDDVLTANNREPALLLEVADLLRRIGSHSEARTLAEEGYNKATVSHVKNGCAVARGLLGDDIADRILWLRRANTNEPGIKAILCGDLATQALENGNEELAVTNLKEAVALYDAMPESSSSLNNASLALMTLAKLTGDPAAYERASTKIEKAASLDPGNSLTMSNAATTLLEVGLRDLIGGMIDLKLLKSFATVDLLGFVVKDEPERLALSARIRAHPVINRALSTLEKVVVLAPRNAAYYELAVHELAYRDDVEGLRRIKRRLEGVELDLSDQTKKASDAAIGLKDQELKQTTKVELARAESILPVARAKGGATFAVAVSRVLNGRIAASVHGAAVDRDATVALAEEAFATYPSLSSRSNLAHALWFRAADRLARADRRFAAVHDRFKRTASNQEIFSSVFSRKGPLHDLVLKDPDVNRAIDIIRDSNAASPTFAAGPQAWCLLREKYSAEATVMAKFYFNDVSERLKDELQARLRPYDPSVWLNAFLIAQMENKELEGREILAKARSKHIPIPIDEP